MLEYPLLQLQHRLGRAELEAGVPVGQLNSGRWVLFERHVDLKMSQYDTRSILLDGESDKVLRVR